MVWDDTEMLIFRGPYAQKFTYTGSGYSIGFPVVVTLYIMQKVVAN